MKRYYPQSPVHARGAELVAKSLVLRKLFMKTKSDFFLIYNNNILIIECIELSLLRIYAI